jgi:hypothetical protein
LCIISANSAVSNADPSWASVARDGENDPPQLQTPAAEFSIPNKRCMASSFSTVSAQKIAPSLKFWRFFTFLQLHQILTYTLQISTVFILALWELAKKIQLYTRSTR